LHQNLTDKLCPRLELKGAGRGKNIIFLVEKWGGGEKTATQRSSGPQVRRHGGKGSLGKKKAFQEKGEKNPASHTRQKKEHTPQANALGENRPLQTKSRVFHERAHKEKLEKKPSQRERRAGRRQKLEQGGIEKIQGTWEKRLSQTNEDVGEAPKKKKRRKKPLSRSNHSRDQRGSLEEKRKGRRGGKKCRSSRREKKFIAHYPGKGNQN